MGINDKSKGSIKNLCNIQLISKLKNSMIILLCNLPRNSVSVTIIGMMGVRDNDLFSVETLIIPFRLIPIFLCFNLVQSPIVRIL
jgi:hypothetical protein